MEDQSLAISERLVRLVRKKRLASKREKGKGKKTRGVEKGSTDPSAAIVRQSRTRNSTNSRKEETLFLAGSWGPVVGCCRVWRR